VDTVEEPDRPLSMAAVEGIRDDGFQKNMLRLSLSHCGQQKVSEESVITVKRDRFPILFSPI